MFPVRPLTSQDTPTLCSSADVETYLERYADHFQLWKHIRFNTSISSVKRDDANNQWMLDVVRKTPEGDATETVAFDKVIIASGANEKPRIPIVEGIENFAGRVLHSQAFKKYALLVPRICFLPLTTS